MKDLKKIFDNTKEDNRGKVKMISLHEIFNKARAKTDSKAGLRAPKSCYHLFLKEQFDNMTREDKKNYRGFVSKRWNEIKRNPEKLIEYNKREKQMTDEPE